GVAIDRSASDADLALLDSAKVTAKQAQDWLRDHQRLPPIPAIADKIDVGGNPGRFAFLNTVMLARQGPIKTLRLLATPRGLPRDGSEAPQAVIDSVDWDSIMRSGNVWYDRIVAALSVKDRGDREKKLDRIEEELNALKKDAGALEDLIKALREGKGLSKEQNKKLGDMLITPFWPAIRRMQVRADRTEQVQRNLRLA